MNSDSPLILSLDLQLDYLSLTIFSLCGLSPVHTASVRIVEAGELPYSENIVRALDTILEQVAASPPSLLSRVRAIATTAASDRAVFLTSSAASTLSTLSPLERLETQLERHAFFAHRVQASEDTKSENITSLIHGFSIFAERIGAAAISYRTGETLITNDSIASSTSQVIDVIKSPTWSRCGHVLPIGTFLDTLLIGKLAPWNPIQASLTGLFDLNTSQWDTTKAKSSFQGNGSMLLSMLPTICTLQDTLPISSWLVKRFGFLNDCVVISSIPPSTAGYISFLPSPEDGAIQFGTSDSVILPTDHQVTLPHCSLVLNPLHLICKSSIKPWLSMFELPSAGQARSSVRDTYTRTWNAFNQLVQAVCPGGTVGLDNKLFTIFIPSGPHKGLRRFEGGTRVAEFDDLRANPRCIIEGQALQIRHITSQIKHQDRGSPSPRVNEYRGAAGCLPYSPYDASLKVSKWYTWGKAAGNDRIAEVYAQVLGAPIMADEVEVKGCVQGLDGDGVSVDQVTRPSIGACYIAAYVLEQDGKRDFHSCIEAWMERTSTGHSHRSLRRVRSTLACVQEDLEDVDDSAIKCESTMIKDPSSDGLSPAINVRLKRSVTVSVGDHQYSMLSPPASARERSSSFNSTPLLSIGSSSSSRYDDTSLLSSPREHSTLSPSFAQIEVDTSADMHEVGRRGTVQLGEPDDDLWQFYGAMLEEYIRLSDMVNGTG